ncbi:MAG: PEGA domain-containing protein [Luteitalea sp.]|nr:PEGA domain-containing protein [Luteitalea sp.]
MTAAILAHVTMDEHSSSAPVAPPSAIETASERLEVYLKTRRSAEPGPDSRPDDLKSGSDVVPPADGDNAVSVTPGAQPRDRRLAPRWIKVALTLAIIIAAAEGAYIAWRSAAPIAPGSETSTAAGPPKRSEDRTVERPPATDDRAPNAPPTTPPAAPSATLTTGTIEVRTTPPGASVVFGGRRRGATPLTIRDVAPGIHELEVGGRFGSRFQRVTVRAGRTSVVELDVPRPRS